jgi:multidrug transporter EmrE-like cation transporter
VSPLTNNATAILFTILISTIGVGADYYLKVASTKERPFATFAFLVGVTLIAATAVGGVIAMRHIKLASLASVYSAWTILLLTFIGRVSFGEKLSSPEVAGVSCAILSIALFFRPN